jgi:hypothetical protein
MSGEVPIVDMYGRVLTKGDRVSIEGPMSPMPPQVGTVVGAFPEDPQGFAGAVTIDLGSGVHEYVPAKWLRFLPPPKAKQP